MSALAKRWPDATWRPVTYAPVARTFTAPPLGWILHVTVSNGSPWSGFETAPMGKRRFSHLWVAKDGRAEQYAELDHDSWAQGDGNDLYYSVETEGYTDEPLTLAQIETLARFHVWSGTPDHLANTPGEPGIGTHQMGGAAWGGHTCPDPAMGLPGPRSKQRSTILATAQAIRATGGPDMPLTTTDADLVVTRLLNAVVGDPTQPGSVKVAVALQRAGNALPDLQAKAAALAAQITALPTGGTATVDTAALAATLIDTLGPTLAGKVADELATRLVR